MPIKAQPDYRKISTFEELESIASHDPGHLVLAYVKLQLLEQYFLKGNSKKHDLQLIKESIYRHGFKIAMRYSSELTNIAGNKGAIQGGNGRLETLLYAYNHNFDAPVGIIVDGDDWYAPLLFGVDDENEAEAIAYSYVDNALTMAGGEYTFMDITRMFNPNELQEQFDAIAELGGDLPVGIDAEDLKLWEEMQRNIPLEFDDIPIPEEEQKEGRGKRSKEVECVCPECGHEFIKTL